MNKKALGKILLGIVITFGGFIPPSSAQQMIRPVLQLGSQGTSVAELQGVLYLLGYYQGSVDGIYGENTRLAVIAFQKSVRISPQGIMDRPTWEKLLPNTVNSTPPTNTNNSTPTPNNSTPVRTNPSNNNFSQYPLLREGMEGEYVKKLQERLKFLGYYRGVIDGVYGRETLLSVIEAQKRLGLSADGIVGGETWRRLFN